MRHMTTSSAKTSSFARITNGALGTLLGLVSEVEPKTGDILWSGRITSPVRPHMHTREPLHWAVSYVPTLVDPNERSHYLCCGSNG